MASKISPVVAAHERMPAGSEAGDDHGLAEPQGSAAWIESDDLLERMQWMRASNRRVVERSEQLVTESIRLLARIGYR